MKKKFFAFLEWLGVRCSNCGGSESTVSTTRELEWGSNMGGVLFEDPYYVRYRLRTCKSCGHILARVFDGTEDVNDPYISTAD